MSAKKGYLAGLASAGTGANVKATEEEAPPTVAAKPGLPLSPVRPCPLTALRITAKNPFQPLAPDELTRLADDIRKNGVLVPLIVLPGKNHPGGRILAGHNRAKAAKLAGLDTVPVQYIEGKLSKDEERRLIITDNLLRRQLDTAQKAALLAALYPGYFDGPEQAGRKKELVHGAPINAPRGSSKGRRGVSRYRKKSQGSTQDRQDNSRQDRERQADTGRIQDRRRDNSRHAPGQAKTARPEKTRRQGRNRTRNAGLVNGDRQG